MSGGKSSSRNKSGNQSQSGTFVDPSQQPFLEFLRSQGQGLAGQQLGAGSDFQQFAGGAQNALMSFLQPQQNPFLQGQIEQGQGLINRNLQENILPSIGGGAASAGQRGSSRQGVAEGIAARSAIEQQSQLSQNLLGQDFQAQQQRALQALQFAPQIGGLQFSPLSNFANILGGPNNLAGSTSSGFGKGSGNSKSLGF